MADDFNLNNVLYIIEAFVLALFIIFQRRKWRNNRPEPASRYGFDNAAPFSISFAVDSRLQAVSYDEIVPNLRMGFPARQDSKIYLSQISKKLPDASSAEQTCVLAIVLEDIRGCEWITLERTTEPLERLMRYTFRVSIRARSSRNATLTAAICIPRPAEKDRWIDVGTLSLTDEFRNFIVTTPLNEETLTDSDESRNSRVVVFLPLMNGLTIELEAFDIDIERRHIPGVTSSHQL